MSKKKTCFPIFLLFALSCGGVCAQTLEDITFLTEEYPPYNYTEKGQLKGIAVDCLEWMLRDLNTDITRENFRSLPIVTAISAFKIWKILGALPSAWSPMTSGNSEHKKS